MFALHQRVARELAAVEVHTVHVHGGDLVVAVGRVVVDALVGVAAAGVQGDLVLAAVQLAAAALLFDRMQDVEELPDALGLARAGLCVHPHEGHADKPRLAGQIARQPQRTEAAAVDGQIEAVRKGAGGGAGRQCAVVVQREKLLRERRVVRQHAGGVVVDVQAVGGRFHHDAAGFVGDEPVQLRQRQLVAERDVDDIGLFQQGARLGQRGAAAQQPRDQFKLGDIVFSLRRRVVDRVADEIQPRNAEAALVDGVVVERVLPRHIGHADHGVFRAEVPHAAQAKRVGARRDGDLVAVGKFVIQIAAKVEILGFIRCSGTHAERPFCFMIRVLYHTAGGIIHREIVNK